MQCAPAADQRLREPRVVVAELVLEPAPVLRSGAAVRVGELLDEALEQTFGFRVEPVGVEARETEHRVGGRSQADVPGECRDEPCEQVACRNDDGGDPCGGEDLAERPDGAADVVADVWLVEPATVVAHEVAHPVVPGGGGQEGERPVEDRASRVCSSPRLRERERHDGEPGDVVDAVAAVAVGDDPVRVLHDPDVVDEREQVVAAQARQMEVRDAGGPSPRRGRMAPRPGPRQSRRPRTGHASAGTDPSRLGARGGERLGLLDVGADGGGERRRVVEGHEPACARGEHVLRVPVRGRDDGAAGGDREGQRAGGDLLAAAVRRDEHVGRREQVRDLLDREEPVVELDVVAEAELEHAPLEHQPVPLALAPRDVGVGAAGDHVGDLRVSLDDRGQSLDHRLEALSSRDQAEGGEQEAVALGGVRARERLVELRSPRER